MIKFNELRIDIESNSLIIDISVADNSYYDNIYIKEVRLLTQEDYSDTAKGTSMYTYTEGFSDKKNCRLKLSFELMEKNTIPLFGNNVKYNLFFVQVIPGGTLGDNSPYKSIPPYIQGITFSVESIYNSMMQFIKKVEKEGIVSKEFIDYFMKYEALRVSIDTGHHSATVNLFNKFFRGKLDSPLITTQCIYG